MVLRLHAIVLVAALFVVTGAAAGLSNGDFSDGLSDWYLGGRPQTQPGTAAWGSWGITWSPDFGKLGNGAQVFCSDSRPASNSNCLQNLFQHGGATDAVMVSFNLQQYGSDLSSMRFSILDVAVGPTGQTTNWVGYQFTGSAQGSALGTQDPMGYGFTQEVPVDTWHTVCFDLKQDFPAARGNARPSEWSFYTQVSAADGQSNGVWIDDVEEVSECPESTPSSPTCPQFDADPVRVRLAQGETRQWSPAVTDPQRRITGYTLDPGTAPLTLEEDTLTADATDTGPGTTTGTLSLHADEPCTSRTQSIEVEVVGPDPPACPSTTDVTHTLAYGTGLHAPIPMEDPDGIAGDAAWAPDQNDGPTFALGSLTVPTTAAPGTYTGTVTWSTEDGSCPATVSRYTITVHVTVTAPNTPPTATDSDEEVDAGTTTALALHASDAEQEASTLLYTVSSPTDLDASVAASGPSVSYTPPEGSCGLTDVLTFTVRDDEGLQDTAQVQVRIRCVPPPAEEPRRAGSEGGNILPPPEGPERIDATGGEHVTVWIRRPAKAPDGASLAYELAQGPELVGRQWFPDEGRLIFMAPVPEPGQTIAYRLLFTLLLGEESSKPLEVQVLVHRDDDPLVVEASARPEQAVSGQEVLLDATGSHDPDGLPISLKWRQTSGPDVALEGATAAAWFVAPSLPAGTVETLTFSVEASRGGMRASLHGITVNVTGTEPVHTAPPTHGALAFDAVVLPDGGVLFRVADEADAAYAWDFGDGETGVGREVLHHYARGGSFDVGLTRSTEQGDQKVTQMVLIDPVHASGGLWWSVWVLSASALALLLIVAVAARRRRRARGGRPDA